MWVRNNPFREWRGFIGGWVRSALYLRRLHDLPLRHFRRYDGQSGAASNKQHKRERGCVAGLDDECIQQEAGEPQGIGGTRTITA